MRLIILGMLEANAIARRETAERVIVLDGSEGWKQIYMMCNIMVTTGIYLIGNRLITFDYLIYSPKVDQ